MVVIPILESAATWLMNWAPVITGVGSFVLTAGLVYLYKIQTEIQEQQKSLSESSHEAILRIEDYGLASQYDITDIREEAGLGRDDSINSGVVIVRLSNFGKAAADDLRAELYFDGGQSYLSINTILSYGSHFDPLAFTGEGGVIGAEEKDVRFHSEFSVSKDELPERWDLEGSEPDMLSPTEVMWLIQDSGEQEIEVGLKIHYRDGVGYGEPKTLFRSRVDLGDIQDFRSIEHVGEPIFD
ncbi:hypothetical protein [Halorubrum salipaludis]|uniref:hypothetical protein n=1 Tax=Halorubrum salipaludis TaxID=2032630 RepID=UPI001181C112|nr:hypothetical protein [Halorubrum salipaludis]